MYLLILWPTSCEVLYGRHTPENKVVDSRRNLLDRILEYVENNRDRSLSPQEIAGGLELTLIDLPRRSKQRQARAFKLISANRPIELLGLIKLHTKNGRASGASKKAPTTESSAAVNGNSSERVFFLDASGGHIESLNPDGSDRRVILEGLKRIPDGIEVDAEAGHIYWTNMGNPTKNDGSIERANLDGTNRKTIVSQGATFTPKQLKLDKQGSGLVRSAGRRSIPSAT
jgi:low-density lipoprotein receptor class B